jgi:tRNA A-37 threonylcarbamoyl transferase component Bud32
MEFRRYSGNRFRGWLHRDFEPPLALLDNPDRLHDFVEAEKLLDCTGRQISRALLSVGGRRQSCFVYYFTNTSLSRGLRRSYAFRSLRLSRKLRNSGIGTLEVLAALKRRGDFLNWQSILVAREIAPVCELPAAEHHLFQIHPSVPLSPLITRELARELAFFHRQGFFHGDLKSRHILVNSEKRRPRFYFVDLEKTLYLPRLPRSLRAILESRDLVQLFASLPHDNGKRRHLQEELLEAYLEAACHPPRLRKIFRRILELYGPEGGFRQGETLWTNIRKSFAERRHLAHKR